VALLRDDDEATEYISGLEDGGEVLKCTAVNSFELFLGAWRSRNRDDNIRGVKSLLEDLVILGIDFESSFICGRVAAELAARGEALDVKDVLIAGVALMHGETLVTRNVGHFNRVTGLHVEQW